MWFRHNRRNLGAQDCERARQAAEEQQPKAKRELQEIGMAETKAEALAAFDAFIKRYALKYEKATALRPRRNGGKAEVRGGYD